MSDRHPFDVEIDLAVEQVEAEIEAAYQAYAGFTPPGWRPLSPVEVRQMLEALVDPEASPAKKRLARKVVDSQFEQAQAARRGP